MVVVSNNFDAPVDGVLLVTPGTKLIVNDQELGTATLYITQNNVVWGGGVTPAGSVASTVSLLYPTISLHAIQRDPSPALYLQLSYELNLPGLQQSDDNGDDYDDEDMDSGSQLRFVPENEHSLQAMYNALSTGQSLHPDPVQNPIDDDFMDGEEYDDDDEEDEAFEDAEESNGTAEQAASRLQQMRLGNSNGDSHGDGDATENGPQ